ncbi:MAG: dodecin [Acidimicrobiia bacterium]
MDNGTTYRIEEVVGTSSEGIEQAIVSGVADAGAAGRKLDWFEVREVRGQIEGGKVAWYQVRMGVGYRAE